MPNLKRLFDLCFGIFGLVVFLPLVVLISLVVFLKDKKNPFYLSKRVGLNGKDFTLYKIRTMSVCESEAKDDFSKIDSTASDDPRLTSVGRFLRKFKLDELPQILNVILGDISFVGPRPNVRRETDLYSSEELKLLSIKPGITDISSIVFSDLEKILAGKEDANIAYNQLVRPWKSRLGLLYIKNSSVLLDLELIILTLLSIFKREEVLERVSKIVESLGGEDKLVQVCRRKEPLSPFPPPGCDEIITSRKAA